MTKDDDTPPRGQLTLDDRLRGIDDCLRVIMEKIEGIPLRVRALEFVVYGACGLGLVAIAGAIIALVLKKT